MPLKAAVIMGSDSDLETLRPAFRILDDFGVKYNAHVISAHRTPLHAARFASEAKEKGFGVIIAAAGKAAHLAGVLAAYTILPVIGVPIKSSALDGLDALLSTVQMPAGVPVATVAIDNALNAALLAVQILSLSDESLSAKLEEFKARLSAETIEKDTALQSRL